MRGRVVVCQLWLAAFAAWACAACATRGFVPPTDPGAPLPDIPSIQTAVAAPCQATRTFTAELSLAGRVGSERLRGRVVSGFGRPDAMRLEGVAPFGPPAFVLVAREGVATLVLPRDNAVLDGSRPEQVLEALTGLALTPTDLQDILTGCLAVTAPVVAGRQHDNGAVSLTTDAGAVIYLARDGGIWRVRAVVRRPWTIEYVSWQGRFPLSVRVRSDADTAVDMSASVSQQQANIDLDAAAFAVVVPAGAHPITLEELRQAGPLRGQP